MTAGSILSPESLPTRPFKIGVLLLILFVASVPRFLDLAHPSFTYDELADFRDSIIFCDRFDLTEPASDGYLNGQLPFVISCGLYRLLGWKEIVPRLLSVLASLLAIHAIFVISNRLFGFWWAVLTASLLSLSPFYISSSRLAFSHGHGFPNFLILWGLYSIGKITDDTVKPTYLRAGLSSFLLGLATGSDLLTAFWSLTAFLALVYWNRKAPKNVQILVALIFLAGTVIGVFVASPAYFVDVMQAKDDITRRLRLWDGLRGYLWLGHRVETIPAYYYLVITLVKFVPIASLLALLTIVFFVSEAKNHHPFHRFLFFCFWPFLYFSVKSWKSPYYLSPYIPIFYLLIVGTLQRLFRSSVFQSRRFLGALLIVSILGMQIYSSILIHPDYLMLGIHYGERFYGEFQGPAVSHAQWIGEAFEYVSQDSDGEEAFVVVFDDVGNIQVDYYQWKYDIAFLTTKTPPEIAEESSTLAAKINYIVLSRDAIKMYAPLHKRAIEKNVKLVTFLEHTQEFQVVKTFFSGNLPMMWVYKSVP